MRCILLGLGEPRVIESDGIPVPSGRRVPAGVGFPCFSRRYGLTRLGFDLVRVTMADNSGPTEAEYRLDPQLHEIAGEVLAGEQRRAERARRHPWWQGKIYALPLLSAAGDGAVATHRRNQVAARLVEVYGDPYDIMTRPR